jgi:hypothetical protein
MITEFLFQQIADHPFRLGAQDIQRIGPQPGIGFRLKGQQTHLGTVAVRDDQGMRQRHFGNGGGGATEVTALNLGLQWLAATQ